MSAVKYMTESDDVRPRQSPPTRVRTRPELASDVAMNTASRAWVDTGTHFYPHTDAFGDNSPGSFSCLRKWSKIIHYPLSTTPTAVYTFIFFLRWKSRVSTEIPRHTHWHGRACSQWMLDPCIKLHFTFDNTTPSVFTICHLKSNLRRLCVESILTFVNGKYRGTLKVHSLLSTIQCTEVFHESKSMII